MGIVSRVSDVLCWWSWELGGLVGSRARAMPLAPDAVLRVGRDGVLVESGHGGEPAFAPVLVEDPAEAGATLKRLLAERRGPSGARRAGARACVCVVLEKGRHLRRPLSTMRLPRSRIAAMARFDVESSMPFNIEDMVLVIPRYDGAAAESVYYAVKKSVLAPVLDGLRAEGLEAGFIGVTDGGRVVAADASSTAAILSRRFAMPAGDRLLAAGAIAAALGLATVIGAAHWRYAAASTELDGRIAAAEREVADLRALIAARDARIAQIAAVRQEKRAAVPVVSVLEEMSRVIPASTWLTEISVSGDRVSFTGFSRSAAALIPLLENAPLFSAPTFMEPVVRDGREGERFSIAMQVEPADG